MIGTDYEDDPGAELGDPRRCRFHPHVRTSSPDGLFDTPCGACEHGMDFSEEETP